MTSKPAKGHAALQALSDHLARGEEVPLEVLEQIDACWRHFDEGTPTAGWVAVERNQPAPKTLGEAFGVKDHRGASAAMLKRKRLALAEPRLVALFTGQGCTKLPKTRDGYEEAATRLKLTVSEVEDWCAKYLVKSRKRAPP